MLTRSPIGVGALVLAALCVTASGGDARAGFLPGEFVTYSQDNWGTMGTPAAQLLINRFFDLYPNGVFIGSTGAAGNVVVWDNGEAILDYLPTSGDPGAFDNDLQNPVSTSAGVLGGDALALQLTVDFSDAGFLSGSAGIPFGDLLIVDTAFSDFNGLTVREYLAEVNEVLGGATPPHSYDEIWLLTNDINLAFEGGGIPSQFAQDHLRVASAPAVVPEPTTVTLLLSGLAAFAARPGTRRRLAAALANSSVGQRPDSDS